MHLPGHRLLAAIATLPGMTGIALPRLWPDHVPAHLSPLLVTVALMLLILALLHWRRADGCDEATPALRRRYSRELMGAMTAYVLLLFVSVWWLRRIDEPALRAVVALLPIPPIALALRAMIRYVRDVDELQQRIELEAISAAAAFVSLLYMAAGLLQSSGTIDVPAKAAMIWVFPLLCFCYGMAKAVVLRRYR